MSGTLPQASGDATDLSARFWGAVDEEVDIAAIVASNRSNNQVLFEAENAKLWYYSAASEATPTSGSCVLPDDLTVDDPGRWLAPIAGSVAEAYRTQNAPFPHPATGATGDIAETPFFVAPAPSTIRGITLVLGASVTANNSNFKTFTINRVRAGVSVPVVTATTEITGLGNITAFVPISLGSLSNTSLLAQDALTFTEGHTGSGVAIPVGSINATYLVT